MTQVNVKELLKQEEMSNLKEKVYENKVKNDLQNSLKTKKVKFTIRRPKMSSNRMALTPAPQAQPPPDEIKSGYKTCVFKLASKPIRPDKQEKLFKNLCESNYLNKYLDNSYLDWLSDINHNIKAGLVYGQIYIKTLTEN